MHGLNLWLWMMKGNHMMPPDLDIEERQAAALPRDWPQDFAAPTTINTCTACNQVFKGKVSRTECRVCKTGPAPRGDG
jgi:hypothetical protein